jgi:putative addiction module component (TIGR02574 family)
MQGGKAMTVPELEKITSQILSLPPETRAELAEILIQSLDEKEDADIRSAWLLEIQRRDQEIRSGKMVCKPADQVLREAREQLRCTE